MAKDTLCIKMSPALCEAVGIQPGNDGIDYFILLGINRTVADAAPIDQGILERSKALRKWQNSPQYGPEVVKLLPQLHRVGKILKDPLRRQAYLEQLERSERGDQASVIEEFTELVRAAMADNQIDANARRELTRFATERNLPQPDAQRIFVQVREELKAQRAAEAAKPKEEEWEFRIAEQGEEGFALMLHGLASSDSFTEQSPGSLMAQAGKYGIAPDRAAQLLAEFQKVRFTKMVKRAAGGGVVSDAQARLLLAKSSAYGLDSHQAYDIIADYSLSIHSTEDALNRLAMAETFSSDDIGEIVANKSTVQRRRGLNLSGMVPDWLRNVVLIVIGGGALVLFGLWAQSQFGRSHATGVIERPAATSPDARPVVDQPPSAPDGPAAPAPPAAPTMALVNKPDPPSGVIAFQPEKPGDPPAFEMSVTEVTCAQYQEFLKATLESAPADWPGGQPAAGAEAKPVTNIPWVKASAYCQWLAGQRGWPAQSVRLPSHAEFKRALRGRTTRGTGNPTAPGYWAKARLGTGSGPNPVKDAQFDKIFIPGSAQMYDLLGNVAEWGHEDQAGQRALLGGDFSQTGPDFDPLQLRWQAAETASPTVGFRFVHLLGQ